MRRMLISGAVALALVATMGVHVASAAKGKGPQNRHPNKPIQIVLEANNLTTGESGRDISASAGDEVCIKLKVRNRTGEAQDLLVNVTGGIPGCPVDVVQVEAFNSGEFKEEEVCGVVPEGESGVLDIDVDVLSLSTLDADMLSGSVTFGGGMLKGSEVRGGIFHQIFARMIARQIVQLSDDGTNDKTSVSITELKSLYR